MNEVIKKEKHWLTFYCPGCEENHFIDNRWTFNNDFVKPTFSPSLLVKWQRGIDKKENICHSFIRDGKIQFLNDCTHELAGKTVDLEEHEIVYVSEKMFKQ